MERSKKIDNSQPLVSDALSSFNHHQFTEDLDSDKFKAKETTYTGGAYRVDFARQAYYLTKGGYTIKDMAEFFCVSPESVEAWIAKRPEFGEAVRQGRSVFNVKIVETLALRATGYDYTEKEESEHMDRNGKVTLLTSVKHKHMAPDVGAIIFWLTNRQREFWRNTQKMDIDAKLQHEEIKKLDVDKLSEAEKKLVRSISIKKISELHGVSNN